jgi:hypothetical protein
VKEQAPSSQKPTARLASRCQVMTRIWRVAMMNCERVSGSEPPGESRDSCEWPYPARR